jgi:hypothetical protein
VTASWNQRILVISNDSTRTVRVTRLALVGPGGSITPVDMQVIPYGVRDTLEPGQCIAFYSIFERSRPPLPLGMSCSVAGEVAVSIDALVWQAGSGSFEVRINNLPTTVCPVVSETVCRITAPVAD